MPKGLIYKSIPKKRIADLNSGELPENAVFEALMSGEFNYARCEDFRLTSWNTENVHIKNFVWKHGKFRGEFVDCTFSDGEIEGVDFWDSDFKNVTFNNVTFVDGEINSSYSEKYLFKLDNVIFENCTFKRFVISQVLSSKVYFNNCRIVNFSFYLKSSHVTFYRCSTETKKDEDGNAIKLRIYDPPDQEPIKIKECLFFGINIGGCEIDVLNISAKDLYVFLCQRANIKFLKIYCNSFILNTRPDGEPESNEMKSRFNSGIPPARVLENVEIICSKGGMFGIFGFAINFLKIAMAEERPKLGSAIFYSRIDHLELVGIKTDTLRFDKTTVNKVNLRSCHFNQLKFIQCTISELNLNSVKISNKFILNKTKISHLSLERVLIDKKSAWETKLSAVGLLDKPESQQKNIKNVSGQQLLAYFDRADVTSLK